MHTSNRIHSAQNKNKRKENWSQKHDKENFKIDSSEIEPPYTMAQGNQEKTEKRIKKIIEIDDNPRELRIKKIIESGGIPRLRIIKKIIEINNQESLSIQGKWSEKGEERNKLESVKNDCTL